MCSIQRKKFPQSPDNKTGWPWAEASPMVPEVMPDGRAWPRITIVTPSYNQGKYIEETIRSVLLQGYPDLEYIVMDGGSTDETLEIFEKYKSFFSHFESGPDGGQSAAIGKGFAKATGEILAWLNSDDRYLPSALERAAKFFHKKPHVVFANSDINFIDEKSHVIKRMFVSRPCRVVTANLGIHSWPQQGCFWRRTAYEECGGMDNSFQFTMDRDLFLRLLTSGSSGRIPGPPLGEFRIHDEAKSSTMLFVAQIESKRLTERETRFFFKHFPLVLRVYWWFWRKPTSIRRRMQKYCRLEY